MALKLPYRLPRAGAAAQEMLVSLLLALLGASILLTHGFAWRLGPLPGLGAPLLELGGLRWLALPLVAAVATALVGLLITRPREPVTLAVACLALPAALALATGRLYHPLAWLRWRRELAAVAGGHPSLAGLLAELDQAVTVAAVAALAVVTARALAAGSPRGDVHGSARFATSAEVRRSGLRRGATGVVVGGEARAGRPRYLFAPDRRHVGIFGPSGCGKTTKIIVPTLLSDSSSMVVLDIKMELYALTAGYRHRRLGHAIHAFAPSVAAPWASGYNPLLDIPQGPGEVAYAQAVARALVDPDGKIKTPDFWHASAESLLSAAILHVLYAYPDKSLPGVQALLSAPDGGIRRRLEEMRHTSHDPTLAQGWLHPETGDETPTHPVVELEASKLLDLAPETWTGIVATARSKLALFLDPIVAESTRRHDFSLADLGRPDRPTTLYLVLPARDIGRLSGLLRLFLQALSYHLTGELAVEGVGGGGAGGGGQESWERVGQPMGRGGMEGWTRGIARAFGERTAPPEGVEAQAGEARTSGGRIRAVEVRVRGRRKSAARPATLGTTCRRLTLVLDELAAVGRLDLISRQIAYLRGYGIQVVAAVQTANQLYELYGHHESVRGNLAYLVVFPSTEQRTAEEISRLLGDRTLYVETRSRGSTGHLLTSRRTVTLRDQKRPLLTPDEVRRLGDDHPLLLLTGAHPIVNTLVGYFRLPELVRRAEITPPGGGGGTANRCGDVRREDAVRWGRPSGGGPPPDVLH